MGNTLGLRRKKTAKVMKIDGQTMKFKTPVYAHEVLKDYPGLVLLESESVKHFGVRAKPLEPQQELKKRRLYFLVELPKAPEESNRSPRRARSVIHMSAKDRLETLMLARRSASDLTIMKSASVNTQDPSWFKQRLQLDSPESYSGILVPPPSNTENGGGVRLKLRLPKAEVEKLMMQSENGGDTAEKIMRLYMAGDNGGDMFKAKSGPLMDEQSHWKNNGGIIKKGSSRAREKRVGFLPMTEGEIQVAVSS